MRPVVHSKKHYVQTSLSTVTTGSENDELVCFAVETPSLATDIVEGAIIKAIFWELWAVGGSADQFFTLIFAKYPGGVNNASLTEMAALQDWDNKKNVLYTSQGLASNDGIGDPIPLFKGWIKVPKGKQRMGLGDAFKWQIASRGSDKITYCGFTTFKEYN